MGVVARRLVTIAVLVALAGGVGALSLRPSAGTDTLVSGSSDSAREIERFRQSFGDEAVVVLVEGKLQRTRGLPPRPPRRPSVRVLRGRLRGRDA